MNEINPISPEELKHNTGGRINGSVITETVSSLRLSDGVTEILSQPPSWLIRWGITVFFWVILLVLALSWWVRYPELIKGHLKIVAQNLPKSVVARSDGQLMKLYVRDGQIVQKEQLLAQIETTANPTEVMQLNILIDSLVNLSLGSDLRQAYLISIPPFFELGELQKPYQVFQEAFIRTKSFVGNGTASKKRQILANDLAQIQALKTHLKHQLEDQESDFSLVNADLEMNEKLLKEKVISRTEYRQALSKYLNKKQAVEQSKSQIENNELSQNQKQQELLELDKTTVEQQNSLLQSLRALKSEIESWKQRYQVNAPLAGKVTFLQRIQENQTLKSGEELFFVLPNGAGFVGEMQLGQYNLGKVKVGQEVIIKLNGYPFEQFGTVEGRLYSISDIPRDSTYWVQVFFPKGLTTSTQKPIAFRNGLSASAEIVTEERSLFEQFFQEFVRILRR